MPAGFIWTRGTAETVDYNNPERIQYENPSGAVHTLYRDDTGVVPYYYSKDGSYLRARSYAYSGGAGTPARVWKLWEPNGTARILGYLIGDGQIDFVLPYAGYNGPQNVLPAGNHDGWYTIRIESKYQKDAGASGGCTTTAVPIAGVTHRVGLFELTELPCSWIQYYYVASLGTGETPATHPSLPTLGPDQEMTLTSINDSAGREITFDYLGYATSITLPGVNGPVTYEFIRSPDTITSPLADSLGLINSQTGECDYFPSSTPDTAASIYVLDAIRDPLLNETKFEYEELEPSQGTCAHRGVMTARVLPTGARSEYEYQTYDYRLGADLSYGVTKRRFIVDGQVAEWQYGRSPLQNVHPGLPAGMNTTDYTNPPTVYERDPDGHATVYHVYHGAGGYPAGQGASPALGPDYYGRAYKVERTKGGGTNGNFVSREEYTFDADLFIYPALQGGTGSSGLTNIRQTSTRTYMFNGDGTSVTQFAENTDYAGYGRFKTTTEYSASNETQPYRVTHREYLVDSLLPSDLADRWILMPVTLTSLEGGGTSTLVSETKTVAFDPFGTPTTVRSYPDPGDPTRYVEMVSTYDDHGMVIETVASAIGEPVVSPPYETNYVRETGTTGYLLHKTFGDDEGGQALPWKAFEREIESNTGMVTATLSPAGIRIEYSYDDIGRLTEVRPLATDKTTIFYPTLQETTVSQGPLGNKIETRYFYDQAGRLIRQERRNKTGTYDAKETRYDHAGRVAFESVWKNENDPQPWPGTSYEYWVPLVGPAEPVDVTTAQPGSYVVDPSGRTTRVIGADGAIAETSYEALTTVVTLKDLNREPGDPTSPQDPDFNFLPVESTTAYNYDIFGRLVHVDAPLGADADYSYDLLDNLTRVEMGAQVRSFSYDGIGRLLSSTNPENGQVTFGAYDAAGLLLTKTDSAGVVTEMAYDAAGRILTEERGSTEQLLRAYTYDIALGGTGDFAAGQLVSVQSYDEQSTAVSPNPPLVLRQFLYEDVEGRLSEERLTFGDQSLGGALATTYNYNNLGLLNQILYPEPDWGGHNPQVLHERRDAAVILERAGAVVALVHLQGLRRPARRRRVGGECPLRPCTPSRSTCWEFRRHSPPT